MQGEPYELRLDREARKALLSMPEPQYSRLAQAIDGLARQPRPPGALKLRGVASWRIRVGEYRVIYAVFDRERLVRILEVVRRSSQTYRRLDRGR